MNARDWTWLLSGLGVGLLGSVVGQSLLEPDRLAPARTEKPATTQRSALLPEQEESNAPPPSGAVAESSGGRGSELERKLELVNARLERVQREKRGLEGEIRGLQRELDEQDEARNAYEYDLTPEDWQQLAEKGQVKYRYPCPMPAGLTWKMADSERDALGLSPSDAEAVSEAHERSNERVWNKLRPLCMEVVADAVVVDLLGTSNCLQLLEKKASMEDFSATVEARRQVAEVHAGLRDAPAAGHPVHPVFEALMATTSEGKLFEEDLAESFGPDEAKRVWHAMSCAASRR